MTLKNPAEILRDEHQAVLEKLAVLETAFGNLERRDDVAVPIAEIAKFFQEAFWVHFDKEEQALFPEFDNFMPRGGGPLAVMREEHEVLRETNARMQEAIDLYLHDGDSPGTRAAIRRDGMHFIDFLRGHIKKEDGLLASMSEMHLTRTQNGEIVRRFDDIEKAGLQE